LRVRNNKMVAMRYKKEKEEEPKKQKLRP